METQQVYHTRRLAPVFALMLFALHLPAAPRIFGPAIAAQPWTVAGEHGAMFGRQNGVFEAWTWPTKIFSNFRISAALADYPVPIDVNALASTIDVTPAETVITYSHAAFTIRQHMFAARGRETPRLAAAVFFEVDSIRPIEITFSFTPDMERMWPAPVFGRPSAEWVQKGGYYILHTDNPDFSGFIAMPDTQPGILVPYQEHPQTYPAQLRLHFNPRTNNGNIFPLVFGVGTPNVTAMLQSVQQELVHTRAYYAHFFDTRLTIETPDPKLNEAAQWAELSIDQAQVAYQDGEIGLIAGYYESADSARPGYAWFFGRDTLFTSYAINSYGDFALTRRALDFLIKRQREDGKIMHEFSQSAAYINWKVTPYFYASADSTLLLIMAMNDYVAISGDTDYLRANWDAIKKAYTFTRSHDANNDGIYDNSEGTGWVESWPTGMPDQEIYMAALDQQTCTAMSKLSRLMQDSALASSAQSTAAHIKATLESEYFDKQTGLYAFSLNRSGQLDRTPSIYPSLAWWDGTFGLEHPDKMLSSWASDDFATDWGARDISDHSPFYDPISYHQGSVWPLFTGWASLAEYRAGRPDAGYAYLMQNVGLTWAQDPGAVTELLSGAFYQPLGRSSSHQTWSSAMVLTPLLRGLFGLEWDAAHHTVSVHPSLPATWNGAKLHNVPLGSDRFDVDLTRKQQTLLVQVCPSEPDVKRGDSSASKPEPKRRATNCAHDLELPLNPVEIELPSQMPEPGQRTQHLKILDERFTAHTADFTFSAPAGSHYELPVRLNRGNTKVENATLAGSHLHIEVPAGKGYTQTTVHFTW